MRGKIFKALGVKRFALPLRLLKATSWKWRICHGGKNGTGDTSNPERHWIRRIRVCREEENPGDENSAYHDRPEISRMLAMSSVYCMPENVSGCRIGSLPVRYATA